MMDSVIPGGESVSYPFGSRAFEGSISSDNVKFLVGTNLLSGVFSSEDFDFYGRPRDNLETLSIDPAFIRSIEAALPERGSNTKTVFEDFPDALTADPDLTIPAGKPTEVKSTFYHEGAGYKNVFGYYFYVRDPGTGEKIMLCNSEDNLEGSLGHYEPTVVFPNSSFWLRGGNLRSGDTRVLMGNRADGLFEGVSIGYFVIANGFHGWSGITKGAGWVCHSTPEFNTNQSNQTLLLYFEQSLTHIVCFEDILRPQGDSDFNDLIVQIHTNPPLPPGEAIVIPSLASDEIVQIDTNGIFTFLPDDTLASPELVTLERLVTFVPQNVVFKKLETLVEKSNRDYAFDLISHLNWNFSHTAEKVGDHQIRHTHTFLPTDLSQKKLYLLDTTYNEDNKILVNEVDTNLQVLLDYQTLLADNIFEVTPTYIEQEQYTLTTGDTTITGEGPTSTTVTQTAWGDPHVMQLDGHCFTIDNNLDEVVLLANKRLVLQATLYVSPLTPPELRAQNVKSFKVITMEVAGQGTVCVDMETLQVIYYNGLYTLSPKVNLNLLSKLHDQTLKTAILQDPDVKFLTVTVGSLVRASFVLLPNHKDILNVCMWDMSIFQTLHKLDPFIGAMVP